VVANNPFNPFLAKPLDDTTGQKQIVSSSHEECHEAIDPDAQYSLQHLLGVEYEPRGKQL